MPIHSVSCVHCPFEVSDRIGEAAKVMTGYPKIIKGDGLVSTIADFPPER